MANGIVKVMFDGHDLTNGYIVTKLVRPWAQTEVFSMDVPGADGRAFLGSVRRPGQVSMTIHATGTPAEQMTKLHTLMGWLDVDSPAPLFFSDEAMSGGSCLRRRAVPTAISHGEGHVKSGSVDVVFFLPDAFAERARDPWTISLYPTDASSSGTPPYDTTVTVGGNYPGGIVIESTNDLVLKTWGNLTSGNWNVLKTTGTTWQTYGGGGQRVRFDFDGVPLIADIDVTVTGKVIVDTANRVFSVNGEEVPITLDSDWPTLAPGTHVVKSYDIAAYKYHIDERWL